MYIILRDIKVLQVVYQYEGAERIRNYFNVIYDV